MMTSTQKDTTTVTNTVSTEKHAVFLDDTTFNIMFVDKSDDITNNSVKKQDINEKNKQKNNNFKGKIKKIKKIEKITKEIPEKNMNLYGTTKSGLLRLYSCNVCSKAFARMEHLIRHQRKHSNVKPYKCGNCSQSFTRKDLLKRHANKLHNGNIGKNAMFYDGNKSFNLNEKSRIKCHSHLEKENENDSKNNDSTSSNGGSNGGGFEEDVSSGSNEGDVDLDNVPKNMNFNECLKNIEWFDKYDEDGGEDIDDDNMIKGTFFAKDYLYTDDISNDNGDKDELFKSLNSIKNSLSSHYGAFHFEDERRQIEEQKKQQREKEKEKEKEKENEKERVNFFTPEIIDMVKKCLDYYDVTFGFTSNGNGKINLPTYQDLNMYLEYFIKYFIPHYPFLHPSIFKNLNIYKKYINYYQNSTSSSSNNNKYGGDKDFDKYDSPHSYDNLSSDLLCLPLFAACFGSLYYKPSNSSTTKTLFEISKKIFNIYLHKKKTQELLAQKHLEKINDESSKTTTKTSGVGTKIQSSHSIWLYQTLCLSIMFGLFVDDSKESESTVLKQTIATCQLFKKLQIHNNKNKNKNNNNVKENENRDENLTYILKETHSRIFFFLFKFSAYLDILCNIDHPMLFHINDLMDVTVPDTDSKWYGVDLNDETDLKNSMTTLVVANDKNKNEKKFCEIMGSKNLDLTIYSEYILQCLVVYNYYGNGQKIEYTYPTDKNKEISILYQDYDIINTATFNSVQVLNTHYKKIGFKLFWLNEMPKKFYVFDFNLYIEILNNRLTKSVMNVIKGFKHISNRYNYAFFSIKCWFYDFLVILKICIDLCILEKTFGIDEVNGNFKVLKKYLYHLILRLTDDLKNNAQLHPNDDLQKIENIPVFEHADFESFDKFINHNHNIVTAKSINSFDMFESFIQINKSFFKNILKIHSDCKFINRIISIIDVMYNDVKNGL